MAILFDCPFCSSSIQVPDTAAGRQGKCPKCGKKLLVPKVAPAPGSEPAAAPSASAAAPPQPVPGAGGPPPVEIPEVGEAENPLSFLEQASAAEKPAVDDPVAALASATTARPSVARALKKRRTRRRSGGSLLVPLMFASVLGAVGAFYYWQSQPELAGTLPGTVKLDAVELPTGVVLADQIDVKSLVKQQVLEDLESHPLRMKSTENLMEVELRGSPAGLEITVWETPKTRFFTVNLRRNAVLNQWLSENVLEFDRARREELAEAATRFTIDWATSLNEGTPPPELLPYRNRLALNSMRGGAGYLLVAVAGSSSYSCVYEDVAEGELWFLLPEETRTFRLAGRKFDDGTQPFPGSYTVNVELPAEKPATAGSSTTRPGDEAEMQPDEGEPGMTAPGDMSSGMGGTGAMEGGMQKDGMQKKKMMNP